MQIHVTLIPISNTDQPPSGPDPPEHIYHYTTGLKLKQIINSGCIKPTTAKIEPHEKPVAWFSTSPEWEPTATKVPFPGKVGQLLTALFEWLRGLPDATKPTRPAFIFSTSGLPFLAKLWHWPIRRVLSRKGFSIIGEFTCRGFDTWGPLWLAGGLNKQHPSERDLERAREFAGKLAGSGRLFK